MCARISAAIRNFARERKTVEELKEAAKTADKVYLAPDPDREGEAIAWHLSEILDLPKKKVHRIEFNEITKEAVLAALKTPRQIDRRLLMLNKQDVCWIGLWVIR